MVDFNSHFKGPASKNINSDGKNIKCINTIPKHIILNMCEVYLVNSGCFAYCCG